MKGTKHRKASYEMIRVLRKYGLSESICQNRAADLDCLIDAAESLVGIKNIDVRTHYGSIFAADIKLPVYLTPTSNADSQEVVRCDLTMVYACGDGGFSIRCDVRSYPKSSKSKRLLKPTVYLSTYLQYPTPNTSLYMSGAKGLSIYSDVVSKLRSSGANVSGWNDNPEVPKLRESAAMKKSSF